MKTKKIILLIVFLLGILILLLTSSFKNRNACEYATSNLEYIKSQTKAAIVASDFELAKYYSYKALNGIEKTKLNFLDCGCEGAIESLEKSLSYLKNAVKADSFESSKGLLHQALENTVTGLKVLRIFELEFSSDYGNDLLILNTKDALEHQDGSLLPKGKHLKEKVHNCLLGFETSLEKVVNEIEHDEASQFVANIHEEAELMLLDTELSEPKKQYYQRIKTITQGALERLAKKTSH